MEKFEEKTIEEIMKETASRLKTIRKAKKITQSNLSLRSNVSLGSIKRWEEIGEISFHSLVKIARTLGVENEIENLFTKKIYRDIEEVIRDNAK